MKVHKNQDVTLRYSWPDLDISLLHNIHFRLLDNFGVEVAKYAINPEADFDSAEIVDIHNARVVIHRSLMQTLKNKVYYLQIQLLQTDPDFENGYKVHSTAYEVFEVVGEQYATSSEYPPQEGDYDLDTEVRNIIDRVYGGASPGGGTGGDGLSAYQIAVQQGFVGTISEWLASLKGERGEQGLQGIPGNDGADGAQGIQGERGLQGEQGIQGIQGMPGNDGDQGIQGERGLQGIKGDKGDKGDTGEPYAHPPTRNEATAITLSAADAEGYIRYTGATNITVTVPNTIPAEGVITIFQAGAGVITLQAGAGVTLNGKLKTAGQHSAIQLIKVATNLFDVIGGVE